MLQFVSANAIARDGGVMWQPVDLAQMQFFQIYRTYGSVVAQVYDNVAKVNGWIDLYALPYALRSSPMTLDQYFAGNPAVTYFKEEPDWEYNFDTVRFYYANAYDFVVRGVNNNFPVDEQLLPSQMVDALVSRKSTDASHYSRMYRNCLFTCNGLIHKAGVDKAGIMLSEAGKTAYRSQDNRVGILDFEALGGVTCRSLTDDDFVYPGEEKVLDQVVYIDMPKGQFLDTVTPYLVCAGKLLLEESPLTVVSSQRMKIDLRKLNLKELYLDVFKDIDLSDCPLTRDPSYDDRVVVNEFDSDAVQRWFLTYVNTFIVIVPRTGMQYRYQALENTDMQGQYRLRRKKDPQLPVVINRHRFGEYNIHEYDNGFIFTVPYHWLSRPMWHTTTRTDQIGTNYGLLRHQMQSNEPYQRAEAYLLYLQSPQIQS